jgi:hypothetical protein
VTGPVNYLCQLDRLCEIRFIYGDLRCQPTTATDWIGQVKLSV